MFRRLALVFVLFAMPAAAQSPAAEAQPPVDLPADLARVLRDYERAWGSKDAAGLARLFTEDGFVLPNGGMPVRGRAAIEKHYTGSGGPLFLRAFAYGAEGNVGYIIGGYRGEQSGIDGGKFTLTLRKSSEGRWLIMSDMDSPNRRNRPTQIPDL
jgi:ketosteroid isomerase-like protein